MTKPIMECGHAANAMKDGAPVCAICIGLDPGATRVKEVAPELKGRQSMCPDCRRLWPSDPDILAYFEYRPDREYDSHYCGCRGWS